MELAPTSHLARLQYDGLWKLVSRWRWDDIDWSNRGLANGVRNP
jgi:hypothetical protein